MAIRLERSGELILIRGTKDEPKPENEWYERRRRLGVLVVALAVVTTAMYVVPNMPGREIFSQALHAILSAIW